MQKDANIEEQEDWTEIISPQKSWFDLRLDELWRYRDLIVLFVRRDFVAIYKQTILGPLWHIIQPLMTSLVFLIVFGKIAQLSTDGNPQFLFYLAGNTIWTYFATSFTKNATTFTDNSAIFGKVYFPRLTVPVANVISGLMAFAIQFTVFLVFYLIAFSNGTDLKPNLLLLAIPYFLFLMAILGLSLGIIISSLTTKYKDLSFLVTFGVQLLMYATPVIYPLSTISEDYQWIMVLNPLTSILEGFKYAFFGNGTFTWQMLAYSSGFAFAVFLAGVALFHRVEKTFMDTV